MCRNEEKTIVSHAIFPVQISAVCYIFYIVQFKVMLILVSIDILLTSQKIKGFF